MLLNDINYDMYFESDHDRPLLRRGSWPRVSAEPPVSSAGALAGPRRAVGRALIGLGEMIAPESKAAATPYVAARAVR